MEVDQDSAKITFPPPLIALGLLLLGLALDRVLPWRLNLEGLWRYLCGSALIVAGAALLLAAAGGFRKAGTDLKPWKTTSAIVSQGIYGWTRNPMYLGMVLVYLGLSLILASLGALLLAPILVLLFQTQVIAREERYLEAKFGEAYVDYKARVRRWL